MFENTTKPTPVRMAYIGCWYKNDMYSHNCSGLVDSLRDTGMQVDVITSNCRCFSSAQRLGISPEELINQNCSAVTLPHAPRNPGRSHGVAKQLVVKALRLDFWLAIIRGFLFYKRARRADVNGDGRIDFFANIESCNISTGSCVSPTYAWNLYVSDATTTSYDHLDVLSYDATGLAWTCPVSVDGFPS